MLRLAFDFIIAWREIRARPNAYVYNRKRICSQLIAYLSTQVSPC